MAGERLFRPRNRPHRPAVQNDPGLTRCRARRSAHRARGLSDTDRHQVGQRLGIDGAPFDAAVVRLLDAVDDEEFVVDPTLRSLIDRHRAVIGFMHDFFATARANWDHHTLLPDARLADLLQGRR